MNKWDPPALKLRPLAEIQPTTALRAMLYAEEFWPKEILEEPAVCLKTTTGPLLFLTDPVLVKEALIRNDGTLPRSNLQQRFAGHGTGRENVITDTGARSQAHRRSLAPLFAGQRLPGYFPFIQATIEQSLAPMLEAVDQAEPFDVGRVCVQATFGVVWQILFGESGQLTPPPVVREMANELYEAGLSGVLKATSAAVKHAKEISIALRPSHPLVRDTLFAKTPVIESRLTPQEIEGNAQFLLTAGHESTALTITWALLILANNLEEQEVVVKEIREHTADQPISLAVLYKLTRLNRVLNESMRLYPAAILVNRETTADIMLGDFPVQSGTQVAICFYGMHRHRNWWENPDVFDPERFAGNKTNPAFMPFSHGHHSCLGANLAWLEAMLVLATTLRDVQIAATDSDIQPSARYTLRPDRQVLLQLSRRS